MKAACLTDLHAIEVRDVPTPRLRNGDDVMIRIAVVGVCGSDAHYFRTGRIGEQIVQFPWIVGHECAGTVCEVGPEAGPVKVGDRVAVDPLIACGRCDQCLAGRSHTCRDQRFLGCPGQVSGALAEVLVMPARCCWAVPDQMSMSQAALVEPLSIGLHAVRQGGVTPGAQIAILGSGPIGLSVLTTARQAGSAGIYVTDPRANRGTLAKRLGADWTGNPKREDIVEAILRQVPLGLDVAFECAGEQDTVDQCVRLLKPGGTLVLVGIPEFDRVSMLMDALRRKELSVRNVRRQNECVQPTIDLLASGKVDLDPIVTHTFELDEVSRAFDIVAGYKDDVVKAVIHVTPESLP